MLAVATAALVLLTTALGLVAKKSSDERDELDETAGAQQTTIASLRRQIDDLQVQKSALSQEIESLRGNPLPSPNAPDSSAPSGDIYRKSASPISLALDQRIDFDTTAPDWSVTSSGGTYDYDLEYESGSSRTYLTTLLPGIAIATKRPTREQCARAKFEYRLTPEQTEAGAMLCVETTESRFAYVKIVGFGPGRSTILLDVTVWS